MTQMTQKLKNGLSINFCAVFYKFLSYFLLQKGFKKLNNGNPGIQYANKRYKCSFSWN